MSYGLSRRNFLGFMSTLAARCFGMSIAPPVSTRARSFFMDGGLVEFQYNINDLPLRQHDIIEFIPTVKILRCQAEYNADLNRPIHIIGNIYEFSFLPLEKYQVPTAQAGRKGGCHYLINIMGMFKTLHFNFVHPYDGYLTLDTRYSGYGAISNTVKPWEYNEFISEDEVGASSISSEILSITDSIPYYCGPEYRSDGIVIRSYSEDLNALKRIARKYKKARIEVPAASQIFSGCSPIYEILIL